MPVFDLPDKKRPVPSANAMNRWLSDAEKNTKVLAKRVGWLVSSTVVVAALQRALGDDQEPVFLVKGGVYIEFNLGLKARATTDVDTMFRGGVDEFMARLDESLAEPWGPFELRRGDVEVIDAPKLVQPRRFWIRVYAKGSVWRRVKVEVSFPEGDMAARSQAVQPPNIGFFGLDTPERLLGVAMDYQIAQKLHAASDPDEAGHENRRVHDLVDLLLLKDEFYPGPPPASLMAACVDIFSFRADEAAQLGRPARPWPPSLHSNDFWRMAYPP
ncbi:MAG: nucleotidyl transferase AbiEii/AbiGii toxin family protein, partial [Propionibacteriaceae bacterium]|nr:nucleotidyl transferase AbiEii/AbiGii toxin family protein [Propionibacteriaceae bacterium]